MLTSRLGNFEDLRVCDLFAGTGALGLEALSRGADHCTFVERDRSAIEALRANIAKIDAEAVTRIETRAAEGFRGGPFDLILMDPPYASGLATKAMTGIDAPPGSWASVETGRSETVSVDGWDVDTERTIGKARITLLRRA
jgi:16S rRNA (guanine966-N2)-methyltransferase